MNVLHASLMLLALAGTVDEIRLPAVGGALVAPPLLRP